MESRPGAGHGSGRGRLSSARSLHWHRAFPVASGVGLFGYALGTERGRKLCEAAMESGNCCDEIEMGTWSADLPVKGGCRGGMNGYS